MKHVNYAVLLTLAIAFAGCDSKVSPGAANAPYIAGLGPAVSLASARKTIAAAGGSLVCKNGGPTGFLTCKAQVKRLGSLRYGPVDVSLVTLDAPDSLVKQVTVQWHATRADTAELFGETFPSARQGIMALGKSYSAISPIDFTELGNVTPERSSASGDIAYVTGGERIWETSISIAPEASVPSGLTFTVSMGPGEVNDMFDMPLSKAVTFLAPPPSKP